MYVFEGIGLVKLFSLFCLMEHAGEFVASFTGNTLYIVYKKQH